MFKVELEITPDEMVALGACIFAGIQVAEQRKDEGMRKAMYSLLQKIYDANNKAGGPTLPPPKDPDRIVEL